MSKTNIETVIVNTSGRRQYFDFLPPIGGYLDIDQEFSYAGSLYDWIRRRSGGPMREKLVTALQHSLETGLIEIKSEPGVILFDEVAGESKELKVSDGSLTAVAPYFQGTTTTTTGA